MEKLVMCKKGGKGRKEIYRSNSSSSRNQLLKLPTMLLADRRVKLKKIICICPKEEMRDHNLEMWQIPQLQLWNGIWLRPYTLYTKQALHIVHIYCTLLLSSSPLGKNCSRDWRFK